MFYTTLWVISMVYTLLNDGSIHFIYFKPSTIPS